MLRRVSRPAHREGPDRRHGGVLRCEKFWIWHFRRNVCCVASLIIRPQRFPDLIAQLVLKSSVRFRSIAACAVVRKLVCTPCQKTDVLTVAIGICGSNL